MIDQPKYEINKFGELERTKGFGEDAEVRFAARIAVMYYVYAFHQMMSFCEIKDHLFGLGSKATEEEVAVHTSRAWAAAYGMYATLRTALEATRKIKSSLRNVDWSDSIYDESIRKIIDTANDIVKHPLFTNGNSNAYLPEAGIGIDGELELNKWAGINTLSTTTSLYPEKDLTTVSWYLRYFAEKVATQSSPHLS
jgi:hypothetical protein